MLGLLRVEVLGDLQASARRWGRGRESPAPLLAFAARYFWHPQNGGDSSRGFHAWRVGCAPAPPHILCARGRAGNQGAPRVPGAHGGSGHGGARGMSHRPKKRLCGDRRPLFLPACLPCPVSDLDHK